MASKQGINTSTGGNDAADETRRYEADKHRDEDKGSSDNYDDVSILSC